MPFSLFGHTKDQLVAYKKAIVVCFIYMQIQKIKITSVQINIKQISYRLLANSDDQDQMLQNVDLL